MNVRTLAGLAPALLATALAPCMAQDQPRRDDRNRPSDRTMDRGRQDAGRKDMDQKDQKDQMDMKKGGQEARGSTLIKGKNIVGAKVVNKANENLGKIDDLLVDARSGYAVYGVVSEGGVLGIGDKLIAIPWNALEVLPTSDGDATVVLESTKDQLKNAPNFDKNQWPLIGERKWMGRAHDYFKTEPSYRESGTGGWGRDSALVRDWSKGKDMDVKGQVVRVDRAPSVRGMSEGTTVIVRGEDGKEHTITLGPSWFLERQALNFKEGDRVEIKAHDSMFRDRQVIVARDITTGDGTKVTLRGNDGIPVWDTSMPADTGGAEGTFIRCTELDGKNVQGPSDSKVADVKEFALNPRSGRIPFLILSVGGLAGMGDREVAVPWQAVSFVKQGDKLALNADENTLKNAPQLGKGGFAMLNEPAFRQQVYSFYGPGRLYATPEPMTDPTTERGAAPGGPARDTGPGRPIGHEGDAALDGWRAGSEYNKLYTGQPVTITGTVEDVTTTTPMKGVSDAATLTIKTDQGTKMVQVGPSWYVGRQDLRFLKGDQVTIKGVNATVGSDQVVLASEIRSSSGTLRLRDDQGRPVWDATWTKSGGGMDKPREDRDTTPDRR
jgi:sporulation protein YlmC with PRC-barrel domain